MLDENLQAPKFPIPVANGKSVTFWAFYDPAVRDGNFVETQYPDWLDNPATPKNEALTRAHTFAVGDHLSFVTKFVTEVGDYRSVGGLVFPHRMEVAPRRSPDRQRLVIRSIEVNPPLDDARFSLPVRRPAAPPPARQTPAVLP